VVIGVLLKDEGVTPGDFSTPAAGKPLVSDDGNRVLVTMGAAGADGPARFILRDRDGNELIAFLVHEDRGIDFSPRDGIPFRSAGYSMANGKAGLSLDYGRGRYRVLAKDDGSC